MKRLAIFLATAVIMLLSASCDEKQGLLPPSGGKLYEVLLVGDTCDIVSDALQQDVPGLPQSEPQFDVSSITKARFGPSLQLARSIVVVNVNPKLYTSVRLRREKNVWAQPQTVIHVNTPSVKMLRDSMSRVAPTLLRVLNRSELSKSLSMLKSKRNIEAEHLIDSLFHIKMWVPVEMTHSKVGKNFIWLSNNSAETMKNIVVYRQKVQETNKESQEAYGSDDTDYFIGNRNKILGENIKGETDSMHMSTVSQTVSVNNLKIKGERVRLYRGLWEMTGDYMGGPFVSIVLPSKKFRVSKKSITGKKGIVSKGAKPETITIEGFVFAPSKKKRNAIRSLEAALLTARREATR